MKEEITYTLHGTINGNERQLGKELSSPKKILSALKKTAYPPNLDDYQDLHFVKHTKTIVSTRIETENIKY